MTNSTNIRALRRQAKLSQTELAERMGLTRNSIAKWENGTNQPSLKNLQRLSTILKTKIDPIPTPESAANNGHKQVLELGEKLPIFGYTQGNTLVFANLIKTPIGYIQKPQTLTNYKDLYCIYITGDSMSPEHKNGDLRIVTPHLPYNNGDTVVFVVKDPVTGTETSYIQTYFNSSTTKNGLELATFGQHNPRIDINFHKSDIRFIHKVLTYNQVLGL
ncbi:MAG: helix-turn-helix domain-containing protein [Rhizobiales bacterium]|nr:helix-turn-helix domain-containing protein [Hyphomicrobiales bacterium]